MGTETTDSIDDVLKESEELLDRIKLNDLYDGGASLASLGSEVYSVRDTPGLGTSSVVLNSPQVQPTTTSVLSFKSHDGTLPDNITTSTGSSQEQQQQSADILPTIPIVAKWEKVSSATAGDDDYVPIVDYTKEKRTSHDIPIIGVKSKVSRLEAYREKSRRKRRRRTIMIMIVTTLIAIVWWWARSKGKRSTTFDNHHSGNFTNDNTETGSWFPYTNDSGDLQDDTEFQNVHGQLDTCPWDSVADFAMIMEELRCSLGEIDMTFLEANNTREDDHAAPNQTTDCIRPSHSKAIVTWLPHERKCRNPIVRLFSKKCRILWREKKKNLKQNTTGSSATQ